MLVVVLSDIPDHLQNVRVALAPMGEYAETGRQPVGVQTHNGELNSPFVIAELAREFLAGPVKIDFGSCDADAQRVCPDLPHATGAVPPPFNSVVSNPTVARRRRA